MNRFSLHKDNQEQRVLIQNYADNATALKNCYVVSLEVREYSSKTPLAVADGIKIGMKEDELIRRLDSYGAPYEKSDGSINVTYSIDLDDYRKTYNISVSIETGLVSVIQVEHHPKMDDFLKFYNAN